MNKDVFWQASKIGAVNQIIPIAGFTLIAAMDTRNFHSRDIKSVTVKNLSYGTETILSRKITLCYSLNIIYPLVDVKLKTCVLLSEQPGTLLFLICRIPFQTLFPLA